MKFQKDSVTQKIKDPRIAILLKDITRKKFAYVEFAYPPLIEKEYTWQWAKEDGFGLKGIRKGQVRLKWYYGQKQLFQVYPIPKEAYRFECEWQRASLKNFVEKVCTTLAK